MTPQFSIITVCFNDREGLEKTRASVFAQTNEDFEWIVVDGDSQDGTVQDLQARLDPRFVWSSEVDQGIYDAMNKGLKRARGEWVWFLNAGDCFYNEDVLAQLAEVSAEYSICFGEAEVWSAAGERLGLRSELLPHQCPDSLRKRDFRCGMLVSHQAFVLRREQALEYDLRYRWSSDLDWMLRILETAPQSIRMGTLVRVIREGASTRNLRESQWERFTILAKHFGFWVTLLRHVYILARRLKHQANR